MEVVKREVQLFPGRLNGSEFVRTLYLAVTEIGTTQKDIESPTFWAHVASKFRVRDRIEVWCEDGSYFAEYIVLSCDKNWARVHAITFVDLTKGTDLSSEENAAILNAYDVKWGGADKWRVIRKHDNAILQKGLHSKEDGQNWLKIHLNSTTAAAA